MKAIVSSLIALVILTVVFQFFAAFWWGTKSPLLNVVRGFELAAASLLIGLALIWTARRWSFGFWTLAGLVFLVGLCIPPPAYAELFPANGAEPYESNMALTLFLIASIGLVVAALLLCSGWKIYKGRQLAKSGEINDSKTNRTSTIKPALVLLLGMIVLFKALHNVYWLTLWDKTTDPLGTLWLFLPIFATIFAGGLLTILLAGEMKAAGLGYAVLIPAVLIAVSTSAQRVDIHMLTKERAERVVQAIEGFYTRNGRYPQNLGQLRPWYTPWLPGPVVIFGQVWCYDSSENYYRLGYIDRLHWSDPRLIGRVHKTAGQMPDLAPICTPEAAALEARDPKYPYTYWKEASE
jgi:hypothetical protein